MNYVIGTLTLALVLITAYYAWQTRAMAREMREARLLSAEPRLALDLDMVTPLYAMIVIQNAGPGAAFHCELELTFSGSPDVRRVWRPPLIEAAARHQFIPPPSVRSLNELAASFPSVTLTGSMQDAFGRHHVVDEAIDVTSAAAVLLETQHRFLEEPIDRLLSQLDEIHGQLEDLVKAVSDLRPEG